MPPDRHLRGAETTLAEDFWRQCGHKVFGRWHDGREFFRGSRLGHDQRTFRQPAGPRQCPQTRLDQSLAIGRVQKTSV